MSEKSKPKGISRRKFLQGMGAGVVGSYTIVPGLDAATRKLIETAEEIPEKAVPLHLTVNGQKYQVLVEPRTTLVEVLRDNLQLTGTKVVCNRGECGGCTVLLDNQPVYSCHMLALDAEGKEVITIEGLLDGEKLHPVQQAFVDHDGLQCGFCTPGQIMAAEGLLRKNPNLTREQILIGMSGNLCRCSAYPKILESAIAAAGGDSQ